SVMCLAIPSKIVEKDQFRAMVDVYGARREINLMLMPEDVEIGDYVLVHAGFAIQKVDEAAAQEALKVITAIIEDVSREMGDAAVDVPQSYG
ncbi:MAG TPA: HypC/HybG/HupF family hydrogenase formation chaperone, partial [Thermodesulfovibrionales bacterium]|nr:HypC/HybG/HupF family hydrogenase formation chaperone [Thermodesulfovibrionales bacterium]